MAQQRRIAESQNFKAEGKADYQLGGPRRNNFRIAGDTHGYLYSLSLRSWKNAKSRNVAELVYNGEEN
jgi:hypothetical protein